MPKPLKKTFLSFEIVRGRVSKEEKQILLAYLERKISVHPVDIVAELRVSRYHQTRCIAFFVESRKQH